MKCPKCKGKTEYFNEVYNDGKRSRKILVECDMCHGSGEVPMTNEEWFDGLATEEKAKVFANATYSTAEAPLSILLGGKEAEQKKWEMWLKAPHKE